MSNENIMQMLKGDLVKFFLDADEFFQNVSKINMIRTYNVITKISIDDKKISLRFIEWVVTKYCRKNLTKINVNNEYKRINDFYIYSNYKSYLDSIHTSLIAPFKRKSTKFVYSCQDYSFETTVCQMQFMKWIISNGILNYIEENFEMLKNSTKEVDAYYKKKKEENNKKKQSLSLLSSDSNKSNEKKIINQNDLVICL